MHKEVLSEKQVRLLPLLKSFSDKFGLVGGTAIALHLGHRRSVDFDLFTLDELVNENVRRIIRKDNKIQETIVDQPNELSIVVDGVKMTFLKYPFNIKFTQDLNNFIKIPDLTTLAAMKAFSLGRRAKWKDYVDLYFVFKSITFEGVVKKAEELFSGEFNQKLFREQLSYFEDIDYSEKIDYMEGFETTNEVIKEELQKLSLQKF
jgi:hypothetical protein